MTLHSVPQPQAKKHRYPTERYYVAPHTFVEMEFYKDGDAVRVWPYIGESFPNLEGKIHYVVTGAFETQEAAREEARAVARQHLTKDWRQELVR